jgi:hypothetical protein
MRPREGGSLMGVVDPLDTTLAELGRRRRRRPVDDADSGGVGVVVIGPWKLAEGDDGE